MAVATLIKTATVLRRRGGSNYFVGQDDESRDTSVKLDGTVDADLGYPGYITVTVEPGDKLNEEAT